VEKGAKVIVEVPEGEEGRKEGREDGMEEGGERMLVVPAVGEEEVGRVEGQVKELEAELAGMTGKGGREGGRMGGGGRLVEVVGGGAAAAAAVVALTPPSLPPPLPPSLPPSLPHH